MSDIASEAACWAHYDSVSRRLVLTRGAEPHDTISCPIEWLRFLPGEARRRPEEVLDDLWEHHRERFLAWMNVRGQEDTMKHLLAEAWESGKRFNAALGDFK